MSSEENSVENQTAPTSQEPEQQNVVSRVASLPLVSSTYDMVSAAYTSTKETHPYLKSVCDVAEKGVKTIVAVATSSAQPLLTKLEPQIATANEYACKGLDKLEEKLPILQRPSETVVADTKELVSTKVTGARDAVSSTVNSTKGAVTSSVTGMMGLAKGAVQGSVEMTRSVVAGGVNTVMGSRVGQMVATGVDAVLGTSEKLVDHYLPMTDQELAELATSVEGFEMATVEQQKERRSYFVRLGSLSSKLRQRAYQHSLAKLKDAKQGTQDVLSQLHQTIVLIEHVKQGVDQKLQGGQEKLHQMWLDWNQKQTGRDEALDSSVQPEVESQTLAMFRGLTHQLQLSCVTLMASVQGLPASIQEKVQQVRHTVEELHSSFSAASSFQDVPNAILLQSRERIAKARGSVDEMVDYVVQSIPLPWVVGPFAPNLVEHPEELSVDNGKAGDGLQAQENPDKKPGSPQQESSEPKKDPYPEVRIDIADCGDGGRGASLLFQPGAHNGLMPGPSLKVAWEFTRGQPWRGRQYQSDRRPSLQAKEWHLASWRMICKRMIKFCGVHAPKAPAQTCGRTHKESPLVKLNLRLPLHQSRKGSHSGVYKDRSWAGPAARLLEPNRRTLLHLTLTMASTDSAASSPPPAEEQDQKSMADRVANLPLVSSAYDMVSAAYASTKESYPYVKSVCDVAEKGVKTIASVAVSGAQPLLDKLEPQISTANEYACKGLDKLEEKLPVLQQPTDKVISDTKELVTSTVTGAKDAISSTVTGMVDKTKGAVQGGMEMTWSAVQGGVEMTRSAVQGGVEMTRSAVQGGVEMTRSAVQGGVEMTQSAVSSSVNTVSSVGHMVASGMDAVLGKSEALVDHYLPLTDEELAKLATSVEGFDMATVEQQKEQRSYFVRLGSLSSKLHHRAYQHSLAKLKDAKQGTQDVLSQLQQTIVLIEQLKQGVDQKIQSGQEKLNQTWLQWRQQQNPEASQKDVTTGPEQIESRALEVSRGLAQQLQSATLALVSNLQGLPAGLQEKVGLVRQNVEDLRASFASAGSFQDLSSSVLAQGRERLTKARQLSEELVDHVVHNAPLSWVVGPFVPSGKAEGEEIEME
ncbi:uncharacterized protein LOC134413178 [Elgaria multicarinata webbii]|uniref:uncharacterized protein LOC134413178 n=1 Tax=Elgaria multicarinata webbii TaxID=159646 RepID=UPI002FCD2216